MQCEIKRPPLHTTSVVVVGVLDISQFDCGICALKKVKQELQRSMTY
jgi:hypothetical protein